jgi:dienelactone hydrolase
MLLVSSTANAAGTSVSYEVNGEPYEGYFISPSPNAALVLLVHDWDGLTDYEVKRANMLADMGYAVFAADLFGAGVRPTEVKDKRQHTGELYCFGGAPVLEFARSGADLKGFVTFHGGLKTPAGQDYSKTKGKLLILHGTADTNICNSHAHLPWILSYSQHISIMLSPLI